MHSSSYFVPTPKSITNPFKAVLNSGLRNRDVILAGSEGSTGEESTGLIVSPLKKGKSSSWQK